jgi:ankyrin repeat protein
VSQLLDALYAGRTDAVAELLAAAPDLDVFEAAAVNRSDRVAALCHSEPGAARAFAPDGFTALHLAAFFGGPESVGVLLALGADPGARARNDMAVQPLHSAVAAGAVASAKLLLAAGADPDARQRGGWTALHGAAGGGSYELVALLLDHGADAAAVNDDGLTPAAVAEEHGHPALAERLRR